DDLGELGQVERVDVERLEGRVGLDVLRVGAEGLKGLGHHLLDLLFDYGCTHVTPLVVVWGMYFGKLVGAHGTRARRRARPSALRRRRGSSRSRSRPARRPGSAHTPPPPPDARPSLRER